jgi:hypothetical protein
MSTNLSKLDEYRKKVKESEVTCGRVNDEQEGILRIPRILLRKALQD